jgi:hypothetical protein
VNDVNIGIDLGSTGLRAAYTTSGGSTRFLSVTGPELSWVSCVPVPTGQERPAGVPVLFPSAKASLGTAPGTSVGGRRIDPGAQVALGLRTVREHVLSDAGAGIGTTVISVPARFRSTQRSALLEAARAAGFTDVRLVNDAVAVVIAHTGGERGGTFLAYGMGYTGFELGLVRAARGHYRALGYHGGAAPGGDVLDQQVLGAIVQVLRQNTTITDVAQVDEDGWLRLRDTARQVKEQLGVTDRVMLSRPVAGRNGGNVWSAFERTSFESGVRLYLARTLDRAESLFADTGLLRSDVDEVLLFGGTTRIPLVSTMAAGLGGKLVQSPQESVALGALLRANQLGGGLSGGPEDFVAVVGGVEEDGVLSAPPLTPLLFSAPDVPTPELSSPQTPTTDHAAPTADVLDLARRMHGQGDGPGAAALLRGLIADATALLATIDADRADVTTAVEEDVPTQAPPDTTPLAHRALATARTLLAQGKYENAVRASHAAWERHPRLPEVFEDMIEIHLTCASAMSDTVTEEISSAQRWLRCAYGHDPSNTGLRALLAERTHQQARDLTRRGRQDEALVAAEQALALDPEHVEARELLPRLRRLTMGRPRDGRT